MGLRANDSVHLPAGCKERGVAKNRIADPVNFIGWL